MLRLFEIFSSFLIFSGMHDCKLAKLSACLAKCMTTINKIYNFYILFYIYTRVDDRVLRSCFPAHFLMLILPYCPLLPGNPNPTSFSANRYDHHQFWPSWLKQAKRFWRGRKIRKLERIRVSRLQKQPLKMSEMERCH